MSQQGYKFIEWMDLDGSGLLTEVAIMKRFPSGDVVFFKVNDLDVIDKQRLRNIITNRNSSLYDELWKLCEITTLGNGVNALSFFSQLAQVRHHNGAISPFNSGKISAPRQVAPVNFAEPTPTEVAPSFDQVAKPAAKTK